MAIVFLEGALCLNEDFLLHTFQTSVIMLDPRVNHSGAFLHSSVDRRFSSGLRVHVNGVVSVLHTRLCALSFSVDFQLSRK